MIAMTISERREIVPIVALEAALAEARGSTTSVPKGHSSKYHLDMNSRKLPPPLVFYSERERDAYMKNKNEESRLSKVLDHLTLHGNVTANKFTKDMQIMRVYSAKFSQRAHRVIRAQSLPVAKLVPDGDSEEEDDSGGKDNNTTGARDKVDYNTRFHGNVDSINTSGLKRVAWTTKDETNQNKSGKYSSKVNQKWNKQSSNQSMSLDVQKQSVPTHYARIESYTDDKSDTMSVFSTSSHCSDSASDVTNASQLSHTKPHIRSQSACLREKAGRNTRKETEKSRTHSAVGDANPRKFGLQVHQKDNSYSGHHGGRSEQQPPQTPPKTLSHQPPSHSSSFSASRAEVELRRDLKRLERERGKEKPRPITTEQKLKLERFHQQRTQSRLTDFYSKLKEDKRDPNDLFARWGSSSSPFSTKWGSNTRLSQTPSTRWDSRMTSFRESPAIH